MRFRHVRWRKVVRDLVASPGRTAVVIVSIAVGVFAVGLVGGSRAILQRELRNSYLDTSPASAMFWTDGFDSELMGVIRRVPGVAAAEGRSDIRVRVQIGPDEWRDMRLTIVADYDAMRVDRLGVEDGAWPPGRREVLVERASVAQLEASVGDSILVETSGGVRRRLTVTGTVHDITQPSAALSGMINGFIDLDTLEWLGSGRTLWSFRITVDERRTDRSHIEEVAAAVERKIEASGREVYWTWIPEPLEHPLDQTIDALLLILGVLGYMSLGLSGFLLVNTITAVLAQELRQIGIMKSLGGRTRDIMLIYLATVLVMSVAALGLAVPLAALGARLFSNYVAGLLNFDISSYRIPAGAVVIQVVMGLAVPLMAALYPVTTGARISAHQAMRAYGVGRDRFGRGRIDRLLERLRGLSRPVLMSTRNAFRRKGRLALTVATLLLGGAIFVGVFSVRASLLYTLERVFSYWNYDVWVGFGRAYRLDQVESEALRVPGVAAVEGWLFSDVKRVSNGDDGADIESEDILLVAPPAATQLIRPTIIDGRWLLDADENALVINSDVLDQEPDLALGTEVTLSINERRSRWVVVGLVRSSRSGPVVYANYPYYARLARQVGRASSVRVVADRHDPISQRELAVALEQHFEERGLNVRSTETSTNERAQTENQFNILIAFLLIMAVLLAVVGALGLSGALSINVLERIREIGVLRAIGASDRAVRLVVATEGAVIGTVSWALGSLAGLPFGKLLSDAVGRAFWDTALDFTFAPGGVLIWLAVSVLLSVAASVFPARSASRFTVHEMLAYE